MPQAGETNGRRRQRAPTGNGDIEASICEATERLLGQRPLADISVAAIIGEAGVSRASFYFYFASKHAVLDRLAERVFDQVYAGTQTWLHREHDEPPEAALRDAMRAALGLWRQHRAVFRAMVETAPAVPEVGAAWGRMMGRFVDAATEQIERERATGVAPAGDSDARTLAAMLMWMVERALYLALSDGEPAFADDERLVTALADVWWRAVYAPAPAP